MYASQYNLLEKWLHWLALSSHAVPDMAFSIEKALHARALPKDGGKHVFVAGLARSGSTLLLQLLYETRLFASLTYRDMPFVMCPNSWRNLAGGSAQQVTQRERAHGDGLMVTLDSPEALEEVFWRSQSSDDYIFQDHLGCMTASNEVVGDFKLYVRLVMKCYGVPRYLSKNNNNILRLPSIARAFPDAAILIPFRHPVSQAISLHRQHENFCRQQRDERFVRHYMHWLVHCEFGLDHKPFYTRSTEFTDYSPENINYWLALWVNTYKHILQQADKIATSHFVCHERLCSLPGEVWQSLSDKTDTAYPLPASVAIHACDEVNEDGVEKSLLVSAMSLYEKMSCRAL